MRWLVRTTTWERVSPWRRIACAFGRVTLLLVLIAALITLLGPPLATLFVVRWEAKKLPWLGVVPKQLTDYSVSDAPGTTLSYFGYSFEAPWNTNFTTRGSPKNSTTSGMMQVKFSSGQDLLFIAPSNQSGLLSEIAQDRSLHSENATLAFSDLIKSSAYDQYAALLNTSPSAIRAFGPRAEAARGEALLLVKAMAMPSSLQAGAFSFQLPEKRGFQIGDPRKSRQVWLEVLDFEGHYIEILCAVDRNDIQLSQPELNRILQSLRATAAQPLTANAAAAIALPN